ncbi:MAG: GNAT family N-acetyltransferase [Pseudomonadota bacterium]
MALRPLTPHQDAAALHALFGDEESCRYLPAPATNSVVETRERLIAWAPPAGGAQWAVCETPDGPALGRVLLLPVRPRVFEAAIGVVPAARGKGLALQAVAAALAHAFSELAARGLIAEIDPDNTPSLKLFAALGFRREAFFHEDFETHIGVRDTVIMGLIKSDPPLWRKFIA